MNRVDDSYSAMEWFQINYMKMGEGERFRWARFRNTIKKQIRA